MSQTIDAVPTLTGHWSGAGRVVVDPVAKPSGLPFWALLFHHIPAKIG